MTRLTVVSAGQRTVINPNCLRCRKDVGVQGLGPAMFDIDVSRLPPEVIDEINALPVDTKFELVWGDHRSAQWQGLLKKHNVTLCDCGAVLG